MDTCKYIRVEYQTMFGKNDALILFPAFIEHKDMANKIGMPVESAGFVKNNRCYGESVSLKLTCDYEMDNILLKRMLDVDDS